jgi:hypothetical protein
MTGVTRSKSCINQMNSLENKIKWHHKKQMNVAQVSESKRPNISHQVNYTLRIQMEVKQYAMFLSIGQFAKNLLRIHRSPNSNRQ